MHMDVRRIAKEFNRLFQKDIPPQMGPEEEKDTPPLVHMFGYYDEDYWHIFEDPRWHEIRVGCFRIPMGWIHVTETAGRALAFVEAMEILEGTEPTGVLAYLLDRHCAGDWGEVNDLTRARNNRSVRGGDSCINSCYRIRGELQKLVIDTGKLPYEMTVVSLASEFDGWIKI